MNSKFTNEELCFILKMHWSLYQGEIKLFELHNVKASFFLKFKQIFDSLNTLMTPFLTSGLPGRPLSALDFNE